MKNQSVLYYLDLQLFAEDQTPADDITPPADKNAVETLKKLKENTVPKEDYLKVVQENKELWEAALNGKQQQEEEKISSPTIDSLRSELYGPNRKKMTNLEFVSKNLELRKQVMQQGGTDPFVANGRKVKATSQDLVMGEAIATALQECVDAADGDPAAFNLELQRRGL